MIFFHDIWKLWPMKNEIENELQTEADSTNVVSFFPLL